MAKVKDITVNVRPSYGWLKGIATVDAEDRVPVSAMVDNPGWHLLGVGVGHAGQTTLTFGWGELARSDLDAYRDHKARDAES